MATILRQLSSRLGELDHDLGEPSRIVAPFAENLGGILKWDDSAHGFFYRKISRLKHPDDLSKVFGKGVAAAEYVEFFLYEEACLICNGFFSVANVNNASCIRDFLHGLPEGGG